VISASSLVVVARRRLKSLGSARAILALHLAASFESRSIAGGDAPARDASNAYSDYC
jgi:hypothetical protein